MKNNVIKFKNTYLTFVNYKEPLLKVEIGNGFGYYGTILISLDNKLIMCHMCGKLFKDSGRHIMSKHKIGLKEYRLKYQLSPMTSLLSESERIRRKELMVDRFENMSETEKEEYKQRAIAKWKEYNRNRPIPKKQPKLSLETKNKRGTCPAQLLDKIRQVKKELQHIPSLQEFMKTTGGQRYKHLIFNTFGSWNNALKQLNYKTIEPKMRYNQEYVKEELIGYLKAFYKRYHRPPTGSDFKRGILPGRKTYWKYFGGLTLAHKEAGLPYKFWRLKDEKIKYPLTNIKSTYRNENH